MLPPSSPLQRLFLAPMRPGVVEWLALRPARRAPPIPVDCLQLWPGDGVAGDHYAGRSGNRQVTLIAAEAVAAIASSLGRAFIDPAQLRRNVVVRGVNLHALKGCRLRLGGTVLLVTGECHPCSRMEEAFGPGGYNAVRGNGGLTARVLEGGTVRLGDAVARLDGDGPEPAPVPA